MFYIKSLYDIFIERPVLFLMGFFLSLALLVLLFTYGQHNRWLGVSGESSPNMASKKYFYALFSNVDGQYNIVRKIKKLPGVVSIEFDNKKKLNNRFQKILKRVSFELPDSLIPNSQFGIRVYLDNTVTSKSVELMQQYVKRMVGEESVVFKTNLKPIKNKGQDESLYTSYGSLIPLYCVVFLLWLTVFLILSKVVKSRAYLISQYQRKKRVALKIWASMVLPLIVISFSISLALLQTLEKIRPLHSIVLVLIFTLISSVPYWKKEKWN